MATKKPARASASSAKLPAVTPQQRSLDTDPAQDPHAIWQAAHDALESAAEAGNHLLDTTHDPAQRSLLNSILDTLSDELTALNQEDMEDRTLSLKAASQQLGAGIAHLRVLKQQLAQISATISEAAKVATAINDVISGLESFLSTFPAL